MYFDYRKELKQLIQSYYQMEQEQLQDMQTFQKQIELAKQHNHNQLLLESRARLAQITYFYNSLRQDRKDLQDHMKYLID